MDTGENETLKKKDFLLSNYMQWNETLQAALVKEHILGLEQSLSVDKKQDNASKTRVLLDRLKFKGRSGDLEKLGLILEETCPSFKPEWHNRWLADEIKEELKDQACELTVSEDISHEAATIVHRQFGHSKRLAESEKKALVFCLCVETQKTQNIWRREISRTEKDIEYEKELNDYKDQTVKLMAQVLMEYVEENEGRIPARSNKEIGRSMSRYFYPNVEQEKPSPLQNLKSGTKDIVSLIGASLLSAESLDAERERVLKKIGIDEKDRKERTKLDQEISDAIEKRAMELVSAENEIKVKESTYDELVEELNKLCEEQNKMAKNKEKNVEILLNEVHRAKDKAITYNVEAIELRKKLKMAKADLHDWAERFEQMEKGGRINQIYKRDERILVKALQKRNEDGDDGGIANPTEYFKEFDEFEKSFMIRKKSAPVKKVDHGPKGFPYSERGTPHRKHSDPTMTPKSHTTSPLSKSVPILPSIDNPASRSTVSLTQATTITEEHPSGEENAQKPKKKKKKKMPTKQSYY